MQRTDPLPSESNLRDADVLSGRGKVDHEGNKYFRHLVQTHVEVYHRCQSLGDRAGTWSVVQDIIDGVRSHGGRFMTVNFRQKWVEMSYKDIKDKTDRACRDAVRKMEKNQTKYQATVAGTGDTAAVSVIQQQQQPAIELSLADVFTTTAAAKHTNYTTMATPHSSPLLAALASSAAVVGHHTSPVALSDPIGLSLQQQQPYRNPGLEHSCGSLLLETSTTVVSGGERRTSASDVSSSLIQLGNTMEFSTGSLDGALLRSDDDEEDDDDDEKKEDGDEASIEYGTAMMRRGSDLVATTTTPHNVIAAAADSCMSLDLCSIETDPPAPDGVAASTGSCTAEADSSLREDHFNITVQTTSTTTRAKSVPKAPEDYDDEDMLIESFQRSMDFRE